MRKASQTENIESIAAPTAEPELAPMPPILPVKARMAGGGAGDFKRKHGDFGPGVIGIAGTSFGRMRPGALGKLFRLGRVPDIRQFGRGPIKADFIAPAKRTPTIAAAIGTILVDPSSSARRRR
jgi:hypothetical protein